MLVLSTQDDKYKRINALASGFTALLEQNLYILVVLAAAGFRFDHGYFVFTSLPKTNRVILILNQQLNVCSLVLIHCRKWSRFTTLTLPIRLKWEIWADLQL